MGAARERNKNGMMEAGKQLLKTTHQQAASRKQKWNDGSR